MSYKSRVRDKGAAARRPGVTSSGRRIAVEAFAKVNLSLDVTGSAPGGYHTIKTVIHSVDLHDMLFVGKKTGSGVRVLCSEPSIPEGEGNIAHTAALVFFRSAGLKERGLDVFIDKNIPPEAGLGGGSADAAAVIRGLDMLFETGFSPDRLREIGLVTGMDVPFCIEGGCALAEGRGELLTRLPILPNCRLLVAKPPRGMPTSRAYALYDAHEGILRRPATDSMISALTGGNLLETGANMINVFGELDETGETGILSGIMLHSGALGSSLSGSGSAVVGLFPDEETARACIPGLVERGCVCHITRPMDVGVRRCAAATQKTYSLARFCNLQVGRR